MVVEKLLNYVAGAGFEKPEVVEYAPAGPEAEAEARPAGGGES